MKPLFPKKENIFLTGEDSSAFFYQNPLSHYFYCKRLSMVSSFIRQNSQSCLLDIGYGSGVHFNEFANKCGTAFGIDIHGKEETVQKTLELENIKNVSLVPGEILNTPFRENSFDYVVAVSLLCHINRLDLVFPEMKRILKKDGLFIVGVPAINSLSKRVLKGYCNYDPEKGNDKGYFQTGICSSEKDIENEALNEFTIEGVTHFPAITFVPPLYVAYAFRAKK